MNETKRYEIVILPSALKEMTKLQAILRDRINKHIKHLADKPRLGEPLQGDKAKKRHLWKLSVGDYRIIYQIKKDRLLIIVVRVGDRKEVYRNLPH